MASAPHERRANNSSKPGTENATSSASTAPARLESEAKLGDIQSYLKDFPDRQPRSRILLLTWFNDYAKELVAEKKPENFYSPAARDFFSKQNFFPALPTSAAGALIMSHVWLHPELRTADAASFANEIDTTISNFLKIFADGYHRIGVSMSDMHVRVEPSKMQSFMDEVMVAHQSSLETPIDQLVKKCAIDWGVPFG